MTLAVTHLSGDYTCTRTGHDRQVMYKSRRQLLAGSNANSIGRELLALQAKAQNSIA